MSGNGVAEIITLQFGNYSNFVAAHLFNLQNPNAASSNSKENEFEPRVFWREDRKPYASSSRTFTPRTLIFDFKENTTSSTLAAALAADQPVISSASSAKQQRDDKSLWDGKTERIDQFDTEASTSGENAKKKVKRLGEGEECWVDIPKWRLNPDQLITIPNFSHNKESNRMSSYSQGMEIWKAMEDQISDAVRKYAEESDILQGFQIFVDEEDGFSGMGSGVLEHLSDEYDKKSCFCIGISPPIRPLTAQVKGREFKGRIANTALLWNASNNHSSIFTAVGLCDDILLPNSSPISLPFLKYKHNSTYESSAVLAAALDTLLSPCRRVNPLFSLPELSAFLGGYGRKMTSVAASFPFPFETKYKSFFSTLKESGFESVRSLTPGVPVNLEKANGNYLVVRGIPPSCTVSEKEQRELHGFQQEIKNPESCAQIYCNEAYSRSVNIIKGVSTPITVTYPFPTTVFDDNALNSYCIDRRYAHGLINSWDVPVVSSAHNTSDVGSLLERFVRECGGSGGSNSRSISAYFGSCALDIELEDLVQCVDDLTTLRENYSDSFNHI